MPAAAIDLRIGDSALPPAMIAGGSMGTASWTWAVIKACRALREPGPGQGRGRAAGRAQRVRRHHGGHRRAAPACSARYAFGAQFAEVRVDADTGEVRVTTNRPRTT